MKKIFLTSLLILLLCVSCIGAQDNDTEIVDDATEQSEETVEITVGEDNTVTSTNAYFEIELSKKTQSPFNKEIPFTVRITPKIDSPKTQILWNVPTVFTVEEDHREFVSLKKDITYTFNATILPGKAGTYDITVNVISWQFNTNKSNSASYDITINKSLVAQPSGPLYAIQIILFVLGILLGSALIIFIVIKSLKSITHKVQKWLTPPF